MEIKAEDEETYHLNCLYGRVSTTYPRVDEAKEEGNQYLSTEGWQPMKEEHVSKTQYDLLLSQVSEMRKRLEEVEERELTLIKMLMEKQDDSDS